MDFDRNHDARVRAAAFDWLAEQVSLQGDVLPRYLLSEGFTIGQTRVRLVGPQGIFKPRLMEIPLSITTSPSGPYDDAIGQDNLLRYRYRGTDPNHRDNRGLRFALQNSLPLAYFQRLVPSPADIGTSIRNELNSGHHTARMFPNMSASKYRVELTESQKRRLSEVAHRGKSPARTVKRALALLKADEGQIDNRIADALSISRRTVVRIRKRFCEEGLESALVERARPGQKRKLDERAEAHLVAIACSDPPEGHAHWTLKLLADKAVELGYVESIARETMRQSLKKTNLSRGRTRRGASRN